MAIPRFAGNDENVLTTSSLGPAVPLYKRAPCLDEQGKPLSDFMMIIPQLRNRSQAQIQERLAAIATAEQVEAKAEEVRKVLLGK